MPDDPYRIAFEYGIEIEICDLGEFSGRVLISEYDPDGPRIRINQRALDRAAALAPGGPAWCDPAVVARCAVAHEIYHHRERIGAVVRHPDRDDRERAADAFAQAMLELEVPPRAIVEAIV